MLILFHVSGTSGWVAGIGAFGGVVWPIIMGAIRSGTGNIHMVFVLFIVISVIAIGVTAGIAFFLKKDAAAAAKVVQPRPEAFNKTRL